MTNDGALELSHQGEFVLGPLAGGRHNYKNNNVVQGKQTVFQKALGPFHSYAALFCTKKSDDTNFTVA